VILVDSNVPMYLVGAAHPHKVDARRLLERAVAEGRRLLTDTEVPQVRQFPPLRGVSRGSRVSDISTLSGQPGEADVMARMVLGHT